mmetsp:Transcript_23241/g.39969  ORF Transcript_23241/g.39969 Transcript_23241/m.39969 type:complete len:292 (-) Transcript_23241:254-1129(-)
MGHKGRPPLRRTDPQRQVQDPGRGGCAGAHQPRWRADHPHGAPRRVLGVPDGDAAAHGAHVLLRGPGARGLHRRRVHRPVEEERARHKGRAEARVTAVHRARLPARHRLVRLRNRPPVPYPRPGVRPVRLRPLGHRPRRPSRQVGGHQAAGAECPQRPCQGVHGQDQEAQGDERGCEHQQVLRRPDAPGVGQAGRRLPHLPVTCAIPHLYFDPALLGLLLYYLHVQQNEQGRYAINKKEKGRTDSCSLDLLVCGLFPSRLRTPDVPPIGNRLLPVHLGCAFVRRSVGPVTS